MHRTIGILAVAALAAACSCKETSDACPAGTVPQGGTCVAVQDVPQHESVVMPDVAPNDPGVDFGADPGSAEGIADGISLDGVDILAADLYSPEIFPGGVIGRPCVKDSQCQSSLVTDGVCLDWSGGYCTVLDCGQEGVTCPESTVCMAMTSNTAGCAVSCVTDADCRAVEGYRCKQLPDPLGNAVKACWQVREEHVVSEGCSGPHLCAGGMGCLSNFAGGYCATLFCGDEAPCPEGTECIAVNGMPACLKTCAADGDCKVTDDLARACVQMKSVTSGLKTMVCGSGTAGVGIGLQCLNDTECESLDCRVAVSGYCSSAAGKGCATPDDCPYGDVCISSPSSTFGYCTKACGKGTTCTGQNFCIGLPEGSSSGECLPGCSGPGDPACRKEAGLACVWGDPLGYSGRYACARVRPGAPGRSCTADSDCDKGDCLIAEGGGGYCAGSCGSFSYCPFPTSCQQAGGKYRCMLRCTSENDCPAGHACSIPEGATNEVCYPE